ncbi:hypothetical protein KIPB_014377, partial [Kipferlia bialata]
PVPSSALTPHMSESGGAYAYTDAHAAPKEALTVKECEVDVPDCYFQQSMPVAIPPYGVLVLEATGEAMLLDGTSLDLDGTLEVAGFDREYVDMYDDGAQQSEPVVCIGGRLLTFHSHSTRVCVYDPSEAEIEGRDGRKDWTTKYIGTDGVTYPLVGGLTLEAPEMQEPGVTSLDGMLMLFGGSLYRDTDSDFPPEDLAPNHHAYLYDVDTDEWTK